MKPAAVISCGPSWRQFALGPAEFQRDPDDYELVIGVNWICTEIACDWVCVHDAAALGGEPAPGLQPAIWTPRPELCNGKLGRGEPRYLGNPKWFLHWHALSELDGLYSRPDIMDDLSHCYVMTWPKCHRQIPYSGLSALVLLSILGFDAADLFGFDMLGNVDGRGLDSGSRAPSRWQVERKLFAELRAELNLDLKIY